MPRLKPGFSQSFSILPIILFLLAGCGQGSVANLITPVQPTIVESPPAVADLATLTPTLQAAPPITPTNLPAPQITSTPDPTAVLATSTPTFPKHGGLPLVKDETGIQIHIHQEDLRPIIRHLQALGVGWVKVQVSWKLYQPEPDRFDEVHLAELDRLIEAAKGNDIKVLLSVSKAPEWSRSTTEMDGPPIDYGLYTDFMTFLAGRYQGRVAAYELWNEPNLQREWNGAMLNAGEFVRLVEAGVTGIRAVDPETIIISGAPATTGINDGIIALDDRQYFRGMLEAGVTEIVDALGVHPYGWANSPDSTVENPDPRITSHHDHPSFFFKETLSDYEALLVEFGQINPLWVTEFGWGSFEGLVDDFGTPMPPPPGAEFMAGVSEYDQAAYILRAFELAQQNDRIGPMILWNLNFGPLLGSDYSESGYSILRPDGSRRPAYKSLESAPKR